MKTVFDFLIRKQCWEGEFESQTSEDISDALYLDVQKVYQEKSDDC